MSLVLKFAQQAGSEVAKASRCKRFARSFRSMNQTNFRENSNVKFLKSGYPIIISFPVRKELESRHFGNRHGRDNWQRQVTANRIDRRRVSHDGIGIDPFTNHGDEFKKRPIPTFSRLSRRLRRCIEHPFSGLGVTSPMESSILNSVRRFILSGS